MTQQEKIIVSAYTGVLMCDFSDVHKYIEEKLGIPIFTHELAYKHTQDEIRKKTKDDFLEICKNTTYQWIPCTERLPAKLGVGVYLATVKHTFYEGYTDLRVANVEWCRDGWIIDDSDDEVIAWMYYPEPYEDEQT